MKKYFITLAFVLITLFGASHILHAQDYKVLAPLPGIGDNPAGTTDINSYIPTAIKLIIGLTSAMAVLMIIVGGFKYILSASAIAKSDGKEMIFNALLGLVLVISSWVILNTINPELVQFKITLDNVGSNQKIDTGLTSVPPIDIGSTTTNPFNSSGCPNCVPLPVEIPAKLASQGGCASPGPCIVDAALAAKLLGMSRDNTLDKNLWWVTEMYPPQDPLHVSTCHFNGTCVDAAIRNQFVPTPATIAAFLNAIQNDVGPSYLYEAPSCARAKILQSSTELKNFAPKIKVCKSTTGESVHINLTGGDGGSCGTGSDGKSNEVTCS